MTIKQLDKARALLNDGYPVIAVGMDASGTANVHLDPMPVATITAMLAPLACDPDDIDWMAIGTDDAPLAGSHWTVYVGGGVCLCGTVAASS